MPALHSRNSSRRPGRSLVWLSAFVAAQCLTGAEPDAPAAAAASEPPERTSPEVAERTEAHGKAALAELDAEIQRLENLANCAPDKANADAVRERVAALKKQRDELRENFNQSRFDQLRADVRREWNEFKGWVRSKTGAEDAANAATDTADYRSMPHTAGAPVATHRDSAYREAQENAEERAGNNASPTAAVPTDREAALQEIDRALAELRRTSAAHEDSSDDSTRRADALATRRRELQENFSEREYQALLTDIRDAADRVRDAAE